MLLLPWDLDPQLKPRCCAGINLPLGGISIMKHYETLDVRKEGTIVTARLSRGDCRNAINMQMVADLDDLMKRVEDSSDVTVFVLRGGPDVFCSGIDFRDFSPERPPDIYGLQKWEKMCRQLEQLEKFTVVAVQGECIGGGVQLVLACDARIAVNKSVFRLNEVKLGFLPGMATFRLAKYVGFGRAKNIVLTGRPVKADEALEVGLLDRVCEPTELESVLNDTIKELLPFHPVALGLARRLLNESYAASYEDFLGNFLAAQHRAINSDAFKVLIAGSHNGGKFEDGRG